VQDHTASDCDHEIHEYGCLGPWGYHETNGNTKFHPNPITVIKAIATAVVVVAGVFAITFVIAIISNLGNHLNFNPGAPSANYEQMKMIELVDL
jgi:hypothetical protein